MDPILRLNIHACYVSHAAEQSPTFVHRNRYPANRLYTLESLLLGVAFKNFDSIAPSPASPGLLLCLIEHTEGLGEVLGREFPDFPKSILKYIKSWNAFSPGSSLAPEWQEDFGLSCLENYLRIDHESGDTEDEQPGYHLGACKIRSMPLAVWTGGHLENRSRRIPLIMVIGDWDQSIIMQLVNHCKGSCGEATRLHRLLECHEWIYYDLFSTFIDWNGIWDAVRDRLGELDHDVHHQFGTGSILTRMQGLNKATAINIMLREALDVQRNSMKTVIELGKSHRGSDGAITTHHKEFIKRGDELLMALEHYWVLANGNKEQLQNLVSMMVSLEQISQGESVGRLNALAFTFLPLSFVASIFGMTQFTIAPRWYPAYALPMLALTFIVAIALPKLISAWENWKKPQLPKFRRRWKQKTPQDDLQGTAEKASSKTKTYPPASTNTDEGKETRDRGRLLNQKAPSDASLEHRARRGSVPDSVRSKKRSGGVRSRD